MQFGAGVILGGLVVFIVMLLIKDSSSSPSPSAVCMSLCKKNRDPSSVYPACTRACDASKNAATRPGLLGNWLSMDETIQHVGITTSNLTRSVLFYTQVMGGVEVRVAGNSKVQDKSLYYLLMQSALVQGGAVADMAANITNGNLRDISDDFQFTQLTNTAKMSISVQAARRSLVCVT